MGDECLTKVASVLNNSLLRKSDITIRFGGEEFIILLHEIKSNELTVITKRIHEKLKEERIPHNTSKVSNYLTVCIGAVYITGKNDIALKVEIQQELKRYEIIAENLLTITKTLFRICLI